MSENFGFEPYEGKEPFIFICYKTEDKAVVSEIATKLKDKGVRVWYDRGIKLGQRWRSVISEHIRDCAAVLAFTSPNFYKLKSNNDSETLSELELAKNNYGKPILRIEIEPEDVNKHTDFVFYLSNSRQFLRWNGNDDCLNELIETLDSMKCVTTSSGSLLVEQPISVQLVSAQSVSVQLGKSVNFEELKDFKCKKTKDGKGWRLVQYTGVEKNVTVPEGITEIGDEAFLGFSSLTQITIPNSVTSIGWWAFCDCYSLTQINIPNSITSISRWAFCDCSSLTQINVPNSVTSIGHEAFCYCSSLTQINIPNSVTSIGNGAFWGCPNLTIYTAAGSYAEDYAKWNYINCHLI
ncbi:MAG: leucine-rich repeat protein [Oscillospiraceae bacterium]|jgi:hypothetical protein|nr:leucine-rich repeat protein [Oscillospiraceae bacterium]